MSPTTNSFLLPSLVIVILLVSGDFVKNAKSQKIADEKANLTTLRFVHAIWRHGDRSPSRVIPSDKENPLKKWKEHFGGLGQLTEIGARQHFLLGKLLRKRYATFLPQIYNPYEFVYRSSAYNRTRMSVLANLQGMFAPASQKWPKLPLEESGPENGLNIHSLPLAHDPVVFDDVECPEASKAENEVFNGSGFRRMEEENEQFIKFVAEKSGINGLSLRRIYYAHEPLNSIKIHQNESFILPDWANQTVLAELFRLYNLKNSFDFASDLLKRLWAGPLFKEILGRMKNALNGDPNCIRQKFHAYSGHDLTIAGQLAIFGIFPEIFPTFANAILVELHQNAEDVPIVRLFHKNETDSERLWEWEIADCPTPCTLEKLEETRKPFLIDLTQWNDECHFQNTL